MNWVRSFCPSNKRVARNGSDIEAIRYWERPCTRLDQHHQVVARDQKIELWLCRKTVCHKHDMMREEFGEVGLCFSDLICLQFGIAFAFLGWRRRGPWRTAVAISTCCTMQLKVAVLSNVVRHIRSSNGSWKNTLSGAVKFASSQRHKRYIPWQLFWTGPLAKLH